MCMESPMGTVAMTQPEESVATRILKSFVTAVEQEDDLKEVAERLQEVVVEKRQLNEAILRDAMFGKTP